MLDHGRVVARGGHDELLGALAASTARSSRSARGADSDVLIARARTSAGRRRGAERARSAEARRAPARSRRSRPQPARAASGCCAPYRAAQPCSRWLALAARHGGLARPAAAREAARSTKASNKHSTTRVLVIVGRRVPRRGAGLVGDDVRADLPRRLGRPARARRTCASASSATCRRCRSASTRAARRAS